MKSKSLWMTCLAGLVLFTIGCKRTPPSTFIDTLQFGDNASESAHALTSDHSDVVKGGLNEPARRFLPLETPSWKGGTVSFTLKVDPVKPNYLTLRLWGSDGGAENRLILLCEGKQVGYRHLGDIDVLDISNGQAGFPNRFFYTTTPLPMEMTKGKNELHFEIFSNGRIWGYGASFDAYQKNMTEPSRGIYRAYTHTNSCFVPPDDEKQGVAPVNPPVRAAGGSEVLDKIKERVNREIKGRLDNKPLNQHQLWFIARAYQIPWTDAYQNPQLLTKCVEELDRLFVAYKQDPKIAHSEPSIYNSDWFGLGPAGEAIVLLEKPLQPFLDQEIVGAPGVTRRSGWSEMLQVCRDWHRENRRLYTNQSMINDTYGIYLPNRGVAVLEPAKALPEPEALRYLYESVGIQPWLGSEKDGVPLKPLGDHYFQLTDKGLTKELGFVGYYGEVLDWMTSMYEATRPAPGQPGDEKIKAQLIKAAHARAVFRAPGLDLEGNRAMRAETIVGWRDSGHYPGDITYGQRPTWDAAAIVTAAATLDPTMVASAQQMFADNEFFPTLEESNKGGGLRVTAGLMSAPDDYEILKKQPPSSQLLPMTPGQPDFVFSDEEDGVIAVKNGDEILYVSLYWRARVGVNFLARVHYTTPQIDRIAVVRQDTQFESSGMTTKRADWTDFGFGNGGHNYPDVHSAHSGEELPIAKIPEGVVFKPGDESVYAGKGDFYTLRYGPYLIGMNCSKDKTFDLTVPDVEGSVRDLVSGRKNLPTGSVEKVGPRTSLVLYLGN